MGERDLATLAKARRELEELYMGVPDESVNLTFGYLADVKQHVVVSKQTTTNPIQDNSKKLASSSSHNSLTKLPSLDFNRAIHHNQQQQQHHHHIYAHGDTAVVDSSSRGDHHHQLHNLHLHGGSSRGHRSNYVNNGESSYESSHVVVVASPKRHTAGVFKHGVDQHSMAAYDDDVSGISMTSNISQYPERGGRRRPGIPHSNICTVCSNYIYIFRHHRCLVCGRVYCRNCVSVGMGEMTEGRKCVECVGRRFSQRYIQKAGKIGCCWSWRYPSMVKQQELKWAEKGPRRSGERGYTRSVMMSRSRSPVTPTRAGAGSSSFVMNSPYSTRTPISPIPF